MEHLETPRLVTVAVEVLWSRTCTSMKVLHFSDDGKLQVERSHFSLSCRCSRVLTGWSFFRSSEWLERSSCFEQGCKEEEGNVGA